MERKRILKIILILIVIGIIFIISTNNNINNVEKLVLLPIYLIIIDYFRNNDGNKFFSNLFSYILFIFLLRKVYFCRFEVFYFYIVVFFNLYIFMINLSKTRKYLFILLMILLYFSTVFIVYERVTYFIREQNLHLIIEKFNE